MSAYDTIASNALHKLFGYSEFKSRLQKKAIIEILSKKRDVFLNMPTGSGKSLCYQLPGAVATDQVMVVVSPLLSLIEDQINHLAKYNLCAVTLNSQMSNEVKKELYKRLTLTNDEKSKAKRTKKPIQFLYVTPEQAASKKFLAMMHYMVEQKRISYIVVDEAHCVSEWGHDFRPDYASLGNLRKAFKKITWVACTATASDEVRESIIKQLQLQEPVCQIISNSFRNNLYYEVLFTNILENAFEDLVRYIRNHLKNKNINISHTNTSGQKTLKGQPSESQSNAKKCVSGIIYCNYQNTVDSLSESLNERDIPAMPYHGGLDKAKRQKVQELWCSNQVPVIVATKAFGMGVDKAEVRFVVHWNTPQNISAYYQETGRAGRDGEKAFCRLYFDDDDVNRIRFTLQQDFNRAVSSLTRNEKALALKRKAVAEFDLFIKYCENGSQCRHELFAKYFHEPKPNCKAQCDVCKDRSMVRANINRHNEVKGASRAKTTIQRISYPRNRGDRKRTAAHFSSSSNDDDDDGNAYNDCSKREKRNYALEAKLSMESLIKEQFELRHSASCTSHAEPPTEKCRVRNADSNKIPGVKRSLRENYFKYLADSLEDNVKDGNVDTTVYPISRDDIENIAIDIEYSHFEKSRSNTVYRHHVANEGRQIGKATKEKKMAERLKEYFQKKGCNVE